MAQPFPYAGLTTWIEKYPDSYAAHIALADELIERALLVRGLDAAKNTSAEKFSAMASLLQRANSYLTRTLSLNKKPYLTYYHLIRTGHHTRSAEGRDRTTPKPLLREYLDKAVELDGPAFLARSVYMSSLQTRWGGNLGAMRSFYEESGRARLKQTQLDQLRSMVLFEEAWLMDPDKQAEARLKLATQANALYEDSRYLRDIIWMKLNLKRHTDAVPEMNRALELTSGDMWIRKWRGVALWMQKHADAYKDFMITAQDGDTYSQNKVGFYLTMGVGVPQNKREGAKWFAKSAAGGDKHGIDNLKRAKEEGSI